VLIRRRIQRVRSLLNDATLARPTNWHLSRCGWTGGPPLPLTHWELITIHWTYSVTDSQLTCRPRAGGFAYRPSLKERSSIVGPAVYCISRQREIQCSIPRNFFESQVSRVSLTSLVGQEGSFSPCRGSDSNQVYSHLLLRCCFLDPITLALVNYYSCYLYHGINCHMSISY